MSKPLLVKAQLKKMTRLKDSSVAISFQTMEEVSKEDFALMDDYWSQNGWLAFKLNEVVVDDLPEEDAIVEGDKTPSQRLRAALYVLHMQSGGTKDTFPPFYRRQMEKFIGRVTRELN